MSEFKAGVATKVITPEKPMWMAGYASRSKPAEGKLHELYAKAVCLEDSAGKRLVLVTTDLIGIPRQLAVDVAFEVEKKFGIQRAELMLTASHTHSGPVVRENLIDMYGLSPDEMDKVVAYTKKLKGDLVEVIGTAVKNLEPASLKFGHGKAEFAMNRREPTEKGIINGQNRTGRSITTVPVLVVQGKDASRKRSCSDTPAITPRRHLPVVRRLRGPRNRIGEPFPEQLRCSGPAAGLTRTRNRGGGTMRAARQGTRGIGHRNGKAN